METDRRTTIHPDKLWAGVFQRAPQKMENTAKIAIIRAKHPPPKILMYRDLAMSMWWSLSLK